MLEQHLEAYLGKIRAAGWRAFVWLNPGTNDFTAFDAFHAVTLHPELRQLWAQFDGMTIPDGTLQHLTLLDGQFTYNSVAEASKDYRGTLEFWEQEPDFRTYWPQGFVPLGTPGDGSRLLVNCRAGSPTYGGVYDLFHGTGVTRMSASLSRYFATLSAGFDEGVITVTPEGDVEIDFDAIRVVGKNMNPGCDAFNEDLPSASETMEWLNE
ncbi:MAG: SMI1/KNR4 family protein [Devosia sp.]